MSQGYERGGSPQPPSHPPGAPSPGTAQSAGGLSPTQDSQHPPHLPPGSQPPHQVSSIFKNIYRN